MQNAKSMHDLLGKVRDHFVRLKNEADEREMTSQITSTFVAAVASLTLVLVIWLVPRYQVRHTPGIVGEKRFESENEARKTLAQILGGAVVLLGLYYSAKTYGLSHEGHITDRFTKAIEQLGKTDGTIPNVEVRLGAIYALERIAVDSPRDHWTIMEILTAYVRQNAPLLPGVDFVEGETPRTDIQAILTVLGRRRVSLKREGLRQTLLLSHCRLNGANLQELNFRGANLEGTDLQSASLSRVKLQGAHLSNANLKNSNLVGANLTGAELSGSNFQEAKLLKANLQHAYAWRINLQSANLDGANMTAAHLASSNLMDANCDHANCSGANFYQAGLQLARFLYADLRGANLTEADLEGARLMATNFDGAEAQSASFVRSNHLTASQITLANHWESAFFTDPLASELGLPSQPVREYE